jgi:hypothetical protein
MDNAKVYILKRIMRSHDSGGELGTLKAKYIDELSELMMDFLKDTIQAMMPALNEGKPVIIDDGFIIELQKKKRRK